MGQDRMEVGAAFESQNDALVYAQVRRIEAMRTAHAYDRATREVLEGFVKRRESSETIPPHVLYVSKATVEIEAALNKAQLALAIAPETVGAVKETIDAAVRAAASAGLWIDHDVWSVMEAAFLRIDERARRKPV